MKTNNHKSLTRAPPAAVAGALHQPPLRTRRTSALHAAFQETKRDVGDGYRQPHADRSDDRRLSRGHHAGHGASPIDPEIGNRDWIHSRIPPVWLEQNALHRLLVLLPA